LIRGGVEITGVLGLDESLAYVPDYRALRPLAERAGLEFLSFRKVGESGVAEFLRDRAPDLLWVIGLSQLVPADLIRLACHGGVGFHPTLLPRGRGRAPVAWTILLGERAAVSLFHLTDEPDAGDIIVQREVPVLSDDHSEDLIARTNKVLEEVVLELAPLIRAGMLPRTPQDHDGATYFAKRTRADGLIHWSESTDAIYRLVRAAGRPYHGAFTFSGACKVVVWRAAPARREEFDADAYAAEAGTVLCVDPRRGALVRTGDGALWLTETAVEIGEKAATPGRGPHARVLDLGAKLTPQPCNVGSAMRTGEESNQ
jgi:methionyl-tRNA formyltransferase